MIFFHAMRHEEVCWAINHITINKDYTIKFKAGAVHCTDSTEYIGTVPLSIIYFRWKSHSNIKIETSTNVLGPDVSSVFVKHCNIQREKYLTHIQ